MATEEEESDVSLKEIVQQTLEARGLFASIRAQLLASVFEVELWIMCIANHDFVSETLSLDFWLSSSFLFLLPASPSLTQPLLNRGQIYTV